MVGRNVHCQHLFGQLGFFLFLVQTGTLSALAKTQGDAV